MQPREAIEAAAQAFAQSQAQAYGSSASAKVGPLDPRLRLPRCGETLEAFLPQQRKTLGNITIGVRCPGTWTVYVPATVTVRGKVLVARRHIPRGTLLRMEDFRWEERALTGLPSGYLDNPQMVVGKRLKRPLPLGGILLPSMLDIPPAVERGSLVTILLERPLFTVKAQGKALQKGREGERVRVRNLSSGKVIEGTVAAPGIIQVGIRKVDNRL